MRTPGTSFKICCTLTFAITMVLGGTAAFGESYALDTCPVTGGKLGSMGAPIVKEYEGREIRFCCAGCPPKFEADPAQYLAKVDAAMVKQQKPFYPSDTCVVTGGKLGGAMGPAFDYIYKNRLIRFCCKGCIGKFEKGSKEFLSKLDKAVMEKQKATYPLDTCVVSGDKLGGAMGDPIDYVIANRLVRLCCKGCKKDIQKDPSKYLSVLDEALRKKKQGHAGSAMRKEHGQESAGSSEKGHHDQDH